MSSLLVSGALIDGQYRYRLWREWGPPGGARRVVFVMLNPSTADAEQDDPTIRRCIGYAKAWGYFGMEVVNLFALRATDPRGLLYTPEPIGPANDHHIQMAARDAALIVCAWGANVAAHGRTGSPHGGRGHYVAELLSDHPLHCLRTTAAGFPSHPLYLPKSLLPQRFKAV